MTSTALFMRTLARLALSAGAAALFAGCGGSQPPIGAPSAVPQSGAVTSDAERGSSWMLPEAKRPKSILMYAGGLYGNVYIYDYFTGKQVGKLSGAYRSGSQIRD